MNEHRVTRLGPVERQSPEFSVPGLSFGFHQRDVGVSTVASRNFRLVDFPESRIRDSERLLSQLHVPPKPRETR